MFKRALEKFNDAPGTIIIGYILSAAIIIYGIAVLGPWYHHSVATAVAFSFQTGIGRIIAGSIYVLSGSAYVYSHFNVKYEKAAALAVAMCYFFTLVIRVAVIGWSPAVWLFLLCLTLIAAIVFLKSGVNQREF
jgi:hypothetical protein